MRRFIVVAASMLLLTTGLAIAEEPVRMVPLAEAVPLPRLPEVAVSRLHVVAIGAGAVFGVIAVNIVSGGMITPFLAGVSLAMPADATAVAAAPIAAAATPAVAAAPPRQRASRAGRCGYDCHNDGRAGRARRDRWCHRRHCRKLAIRLLRVALRIRVGIGRAETGASVACFFSVAGHSFSTIASDHTLPVGPPRRG